MSTVGCPHGRPSYKMCPHCLDFSSGTALTVAVTVKLSCGHRSDTLVHPEDGGPYCQACAEVKRGQPQDQDP